MIVMQNDPDITPSDADAAETPPDSPETTDTAPSTTTAPAAPPEPVDGGIAQPVERVEVRWIDPQPHMVNRGDRGIVRYGETFEATTEQVDADARMILASDPFTPDPAHVATDDKEG